MQHSCVGTADRRSDRADKTVSCRPVACGVGMEKICAPKSPVPCGQKESVQPSRRCRADEPGAGADGTDACRPVAWRVRMERNCAYPGHGRVPWGVRSHRRRRSRWDRSAHDPRTSARDISATLSAACEPAGRGHRLDCAPRSRADRDQIPACSRGRCVTAFNRRMFEKRCRRCGRRGSRRGCAAPTRRRP